MSSVSAAEPVTSTLPPPTVVTTTSTTSTNGVPAGGGVVITPTGVAVSIVAARPQGWIVRTPCDREILLERGTVVPEAEVVIDAGHGGYESGAVGPAGTREKDVTLAVARLVATDLESRGRTVVLTRTADYRMSLAARTQVAKQLGAEAFVSIHFNAEPDGPTKRPGTETYYQQTDPRSKRLAALAYEEILAALEGQPIAWVGDRDAGVKFRRNSNGDDYYGLLRLNPGIPTALLELAFISNAPEEALITTPEAKTELAGAVAAGIDHYLTTSDLGSGFVDPYPRDESVGGDGRAKPGCEDPALL